MFSNAAAQIRELLLAVMEGVLQNSLQDRVNNWPANSTRKPSDMYLLACQLLTVLLGYKHLFTKAQQDDMILCFEKGVAKLGNTAKTSIHALKQCSVELPLSMQKLLSPILAKFSQVSMLGLKQKENKLLTRRCRLHPIRQCLSTFSSFCRH